MPEEETRYDPFEDFCVVHRLYGATLGYAHQLQQARPAVERLRRTAEQAGYLLDGMDATVHATSPVDLGTIAQLQQALHELLFSEQ